MYKRVLVPVDGSAASNLALTEMVLRTAPVPLLLVREPPEAA